MSHRLKIIKEWVDVEVTAAGETFRESFDVDKHVTKIIGYAFTTNMDAMPYFRGTQKITINEKEICPEGYESKLLMQGFNVEVNKRMKDFDGEELDPGNRKVVFEYTDNNHPVFPFAGPYRVRLYVFSRIDD